jgi:hypothetical protein
LPSWNTRNQVYPGNNRYPFYPGFNRNLGYPGNNRYPFYPGFDQNLGYPGNTQYPTYPGNNQYPSFQDSNQYPSIYPEKPSYGNSNIRYNNNNGYDSYSQGGPIPYPQKISTDAKQSQQANVQQAASAQSASAGIQAQNTTYTKN